MADSYLRLDYEKYKCAEFNRRVYSKATKFHGFATELRRMYNKIFDYQSVSKIRQDDKELTFFTSSEHCIEYKGYSIGFMAKFKEVCAEGVTEYAVEEYSYFAKNESSYFRFDGTDIGEKVGHPYFHLHLKENGSPRIQTHSVTPYDFLAFVLDITNSCEELGSL